MHPDFWHERWNTNRIGFHQDKVMQLLQKHWPSLGLPHGSRVLVPLAGKSLDMAWLAAQGHRVLGVELSGVAVQAFFAEHGLTPQVHQTRHGTHYVAGDIELICGDAFDLDAGLLADCAGVYDRAALVALPQAMRRRYVTELYARLPAQRRGLLITLEYPQAQKEGPPFSVEAAHVRELFEPAWHIQDIERRDILSYEPGFLAEGITQLETAVYRLERR